MASGKPSLTEKPTVDEILQIGKFAKPQLPSKNVKPTKSSVSNEEILAALDYGNTAQATNKTTKVGLTPVQQKDTHVEPVRLVERSGKYRIIKKLYRPVFVHDGGFIERFGRREPTDEDYHSRRKWLAKLNGAEATCGPKLGPLNFACDYEDQSDATAAYRHFWDGKGKDRYAVDYEKFLRTDPSARNIVSVLVDDFIKNIEIIGKNRTSFQVVGHHYSVGEGGIADYPATVNWQRAIGAHILWVSATITAAAKKGKIEYSADLIIHMEDRYNFNPGAKDIKSSIRDAENGAFEMNGWATQYMNYASIARKVVWKENEGRSRVIEVKPVPQPIVLMSEVWAE